MKTEGKINNIPNVYNEKNKKVVINFKTFFKKFTFQMH